MPPVFREKETTGKRKITLRSVRTNLSRRRVGSSLSANRIDLVERNRRVRQLFRFSQPERSRIGEFDQNDRERWPRAIEHLGTSVETSGLRVYDTVSMSRLIQISISRFQPRPLFDRFSLTPRLSRSGDFQARARQDASRSAGRKFVAK